MGSSAVWSHDLSYHLCNNAWLPSMSFADPLDLHGGPWGHRAAFLLLCMLIFLVASIIALLEENGNALAAGQVLLAVLLVAGTAKGTLLV